MALRAIPANESQANVEASLANAICEEGMRFHPPNTAHDASGCGVRHTHREARGIQLADKKDYPGGSGGSLRRAQVCSHIRCEGPSIASAALIMAGEEVRNIPPGPLL